MKLLLILDDWYANLKKLIKKKKTKQLQTTNKNEQNLLTQLILKGTSAFALLPLVFIVHFKKSNKQF